MKLELVVIPKFPMWQKVTKVGNTATKVSSRHIFDSHRRDYVVATLTENVSDGTVMKRQLQEVIVVVGLSLTLIGEIR